jgi:tetratricopeptide (TPR) repeat protein
LNEALALYPNNASLHDRLSYADSMIGNLDDALKHAQQATKLDPQLASAWLNKGSIEMAQSNLVDALESYRAALKADPRNADAWFLLSQANEKRGDMDGMREALSKFLAVCPPSDARGETARKKLAEMQHAQ